jgi:hypothetical protein
VLLIHNLLEIQVRCMAGHQTARLKDLVLIVVVIIVILFCNIRLLNNQDILTGVLSDEGHIFNR